MMTLDQRNHARLPKPTGSHIRLVLLRCVTVLAWLIAWPFVGASLHVGVNGFMVDDFVAYWAAGRLALQGNNPYAANLLLALQTTAGWPYNHALSIWYPPWALAIIMPFSLFSYGTGRIVWMTANVVLLLLSVSILWKLYGGSRGSFFFAFIAGILFYPSGAEIMIGNIALFILLGLCIFLYCVQHKQWLWIGPALVLAATKPQLCYLFWVVLVLWLWEQKRWRVASSAIVSGLIAWGIPTLLNPGVTIQFLQATQTNPPLFWMTTTLGTLLRVAFGSEKTWLQFLPSLFGLAWR